MAALTLVAQHTANQRLKEGFGSRLALCMVAATALHALVFGLWPSMGAVVWSPEVLPPPLVVQLDNVKIPPKPATLHRPAAPDISAVAPSDATLEMPSWTEVPELTPPDPGAGVEETSREPAWTGPFTVSPSLINPGELRRALEREYPTILRDAGIGGTVGLLVRIDTRGKVVESRVGESSGYGGLDAAALKVAPLLRFRPALNRETPVSVWIHVPVTFEVHGGAGPLEAGRANR